MNSDDIEPWQAERIRNALRLKVRYLHRLKSRMEKVGFLPSDRLYQLVREAYESLHALHIEMHYLSCEKRVRRPSKK